MQATTVRSAFARVLSAIASWWTPRITIAPSSDDSKFTDSMERELCAREYRAHRF
jgi:hypothetical protein